MATPSRGHGTRRCGEPRGGRSAARDVCAAAPNGCGAAPEDCAAAPDGCGAALDDCAAAPENLGVPKNTAIQALFPASTQAGPRTVRYHAATGVPGTPEATYSLVTHRDEQSSDSSEPITVRFGSANQTSTCSENTGDGGLNIAA